MVTPTPKAMLSPALPAVWVMLFSRMVARRVRKTRLKPRKMVIERTATGMEAETVRPTLSTRYMLEAELPREFDGAALLAASGLPRKVEIKAAKDSLKLSTAYRTDQLVGDIVKSAMRGTASDVQRVQDAVNRFIRTVRERRQEGATLTVNSNGRGKIDVIEQMPASTRGAMAAVTPADMPRMAADKAAALEKRISELESGFGRV